MREKYQAQKVALRKAINKSIVEFEKDTGCNVIELFCENTMVTKKEYKANNKMYQLCVSKISTDMDLSRELE